MIISGDIVPDCALPVNAVRCLNHSGKSSSVINWLLPSLLL